MQQIKTLMLPLAMLAGFFFSGFFSSLNVLTPYLIFTMLFITFCRITLSELHFTGLHLRLLLFQLVMSVVAYLVLRLWNEEIAQGIMICILAPTAASSVVVAGMLGAGIATMTAYNLLCNIAIAIAAPLYFSFVGTHAEMPFVESFFRILSKVIPVLVLPFIVSLVLRKVAKGVHSWVCRRQMVSFYLWSLALMIVTGRTVEFIRSQENPDYALEVEMALVALGLCLIQFVIGRWMGRRYGDAVAGGQSLGQKNTILAIWMAQSYLCPVASVAPASYVLWQNIVNSYQLWRKEQKQMAENNKV